MVQSERFKTVGSTARDSLDGHYQSYLLEYKHSQKRFEEGLAELVKNDELFDVPPQSLFRGSEDTDLKKDVSEMKRYLQSAKGWMKTTQGEIETLASVSILSRYNSLICLQFALARGSRTC